MPERTAALSAAGPPMVELFVAEIDCSVPQPELETLFVDTVGPVNRVRMVVWPDGASKGYAFIWVYSEADARLISARGC